MTEIMLGHAPHNWSVFRLGQLFDERKTKVSDKDYEPLSVTMKGIVPQLDTAAKSDDSENRKLVRKGDFVINSRSDRKGSGGISEMDGSVSLISIVLEPKGIEPAFAHHLLRSTAFQEEFYRWGHGIVADLWTTRFSDMKNIRLALPDRETQRAIADFLDRETALIDQLVEKKLGLIKIQKELRASACLQGLREGLSGFDWDTETQHYSFHFISQGWQVKRIKHLVRFMTSGSRGWGDLLRDEGEIFLQSGNIGREMDVDFDNVERVEPQTGAEAKRTCVCSGDSLVCITGGRTGAVGFVEILPETSYINQHVCLLRPDPTKIAPRLLSQLLWSEIGQAQFASAQYGLKQGLGFSEVANVRLPVPPRDIQTQIVSEIDRRTIRIDELTDQIQTSIDVLLERRSALITAAVTGQIDISEHTRKGDTDRRLDAIEAEMRA